MGGDLNDNEKPVADQNIYEIGMALAVYVLYLVGLIFVITFLIGVVLAYVGRGAAPNWLAGHYRFQIRTFWIGLVTLVIGFILLVTVSSNMFFGIIVYLLLPLLVLWFIIRCAIGISALIRRRPIGNAGAWLFP